MARRTPLNALVCACIFAMTADGHQPAVQTVAKGLNGPTAIAIRPGGSEDDYEIFVAESGAGRILRVRSNDAGKATPAITGFETAALENRSLSVGQIALLFLDRYHLVVAASGNNGSAALRIYKLPEDTSAPLAIDETAQRLDLSAEPSGPVASANPVCSLARTIANDAVPDALLLTALDKERRGAIFKIPIPAGTLGELRPFVTAQENSNPVALAVGDRGFVVAADIGELDTERDTRLRFYNPIDGQQLLDLPTYLYDVVALAYSPKTNNLYAADVASSATDEGGLFRIDDASQHGTPACRAVKLTKIKRPTALAFGPDGALYVTALNGDEKADDNQGTLLRITGNL